MHPAVFALLIGLLVFSVTLVAVPAVRRLARGSGLYEVPVADRWHRRPVPKLGGVAMAAAFLPVAWYLASTVPLGDPASNPPGDHRAHVMALVLASGVLFGVGVVDDIWPLRALTKLAWQSAVGGYFIWMAGAASITGVAPLDVGLSLLWFVGITNAFNLLDNIDGLAAGVAGIAATFAVAAMLIADVDSLVGIAVIVSALAGASLGFLVYNWHPASIFMGDGGSHLLGAVLAGATLLGATHLGDGRNPGTAMAIVLLLVPCTDTLLVTLTRRMAGRSAFVGGRDHLSHRIVALGMPDSKAVLILYALAATGGVVAIGLQVLPAIVGWLLVGAYAVLVAACGVYLAHVRTGATDSSPLPGEVAARYRTSELMFDATIVALAYYLGLVSRFQGSDTFAVFLGRFSSVLPFVLAAHLCGLWLAGRYRRPVQGPGGSDLLMIAKGAAIGSATSVVGVLYLTGFQGYSRQAFAVSAVLVVLLLAGGHAGLNALDEYLRRRRREQARGPQALIYGAGARGGLAVRELLSNRALGLVPAGFIETDAALAATRPEGLPVLGDLDALDGILARAGGTITTIIVSADDPPAADFERLCAIAARHGAAVRHLRLWLDEIDTGRRRHLARVGDRRLR